MRNYKFRGKSNSGKWVFGSLVWTEGQQPQIHFPIFFSNDPKKLLKWDWVYVDEKTVGQFTGLLDKNGNEIYEGDIIHVKGNTIDKDFGVVTYHENGYFYIDDSFGGIARYCVKPIGDFFNSISRNDFSQGMEFYVNGNIHEK